EEATTFAPGPWPGACPRAAYTRAPGVPGVVVSTWMINTVEKCSRYGRYPVRVLFTSAGKRGHSDPLVPIARAARPAGRPVAFCCRPTMEAVLQDDGFETFTAGPEIFTPASVTPLVPIDTEHERALIRKGFAGRGIAQRRAVEVSELGEHWQPDVFVCEEL